MTSNKLASTKDTITDELSAQILGLTEQHIHYFKQNTPTAVKQSAEVKTVGIHQLMLEDFQALVSDAAKADITIKIASGFRSFERQLQIWNNKFLGITPIKNNKGESINITKLNDFEIIEAILLFSALPGASRHHWGCDIDIYAPNLLGDSALQLEPWEYESSGPLAKLSDWLKKHAKRYGFYFPYDTYRGGIAAEPWHLSYAPLAKQYQSKMSINLLHELLLQTDIAGKEVIIENLPNIYQRFISNVNDMH